MVFTVVEGGEGSISDRSVSKPDATMKAGSSVVFLLDRGLSPHKLLGFFRKIFGDKYNTINYFKIQ